MKNIKRSRKNLTRHRRGKTGGSGCACNTGTSALTHMMQGQNGGTALTNTFLVPDHVFYPLNTHQVEMAGSERLSLPVSRGGASRRKRRRSTRRIPKKQSRRSKKTKGGFSDYLLGNTNNTNVVLQTGLSSGAQLSTNLLFESPISPVQNDIKFYNNNNLPYV